MPTHQVSLALVLQQKYLLITGHENEKLIVEQKETYILLNNSVSEHDSTSVRGVHFEDHSR